MSSNQPSQASTAPAAVSTDTSLEAVIGGIGYSLPSSDEDATEVMLLDGSIAQLFAGKIIIGDQTVTLPSDLSSETTFPGGISAKPAEATTPDENDDDNDGGGGGGGGVGALFGALGGIAKGATSALGGAIGSVDAVTSGALTFAGGTTGAISGPLTGAIGDTGKFVSSLNGIQKSFPGNELTKGAFDTFTRAHQLARQSLNWMKSTQNLAQNFDDLSSHVQSKVKSGAGDFAKAGGSLAQCKTAMEAFQDFPWEDAEVPSQTAQPSATDKPTDKASMQSTKGTSTAQTTSMQSITDMTSTTQSASSTVTSSQKSSSGSETPTPTATAMQEYAIHSRSDTSTDFFKSFVNELDGGKGHLYVWDALGGQLYITMLNATQAMELPENHDFIEYVFRNTIDETLDGNEEFRATHFDWLHASMVPRLNKPVEGKDNSQATSTRVEFIPRALLPQDPNAPYWKKMISARPRDITTGNGSPRSDPDYLADESGGKGITIYVLDNGFDTTNPDLRPVGRTVDTVVTPNTLTLGDLDPERQGDQIIGNGEHGTMMATIAAGKIHGVAPNADLYLVKTKGQIKDKTNPQVLRHSPLNYNAALFFLNAVKSHIKARLAKDQNAKSVINLSWGLNVRTPLKPGGQFAIQRTLMSSVLERQLHQFCMENNIPLVVAAGNKPDVRLVLDSLPQAFSTPKDTMIIVGAVNELGAVWPQTVNDPKGQISVFAPGTNIVVPALNNIEPADMGIRSGTSHATAVVSGLIAYYYGLPDWRSSLAVRPGVGIKGVVQQYAWLRNMDALSNGHGTPKVVYNLARGHPILDASCPQRRDWSEKRDEGDVCSLASTFITSARLFHKARFLDYQQSGHERQFHDIQGGRHLYEELDPAIHQIACVGKFVS
ncbi:hypothetical protein J4E91_010515 [Alternaria rosae]|nr:hypothetical protein J4E91_010515 [Alternaria rosae]